MKCFNLIPFFAIVALISLTACKGEPGKPGSDADIDLDLVEIDFEEDLDASEDLTELDQDTKLDQEMDMTEPYVPNPARFTLKAAGNSSIKLKWMGHPDATRYELLWATSLEELDQSPQSFVFTNDEIAANEAFTFIHDFIRRVDPYSEEKITYYHKLVIETSEETFETDNIRGMSPLPLSPVLGDFDWALLECREYDRGNVLNTFEQLFEYYHIVGFGFHSQFKIRLIDSKVDFNHIIVRRGDNLFANDQANHIAMHARSATPGQWNELSLFRHRIEPSGSRYLVDPTYYPGLNNLFLVESNFRWFDPNTQYIQNEDDNYISTKYMIESETYALDLQSTSGISSHYKGGGLSSYSGTRCTAKFEITTTKTFYEPPHTGVKDWKLEVQMHDPELRNTKK